MNFLSPLFFLCSVGFCLQCNNVWGYTDNINMYQNEKSLPRLDFKRGYPKDCYIKCDIFDYGLYGTLDYGQGDNFFNIDSDGYVYFNKEPTDTPTIPKENTENYNSGTDAIISQQQTANFTEQKLDQNSDKGNVTYEKENRRMAQNLLDYLSAMMRNANSDSTDSNNSNQVKSWHKFNEQESIKNQIKKSDLNSAQYDLSNDKTNENLKEYQAVKGLPFDSNTFINSDIQKRLSSIRDEEEDQYIARFKNWLQADSMDQLRQQIQEALKSENVNTNINKLD